MNPAFVAVRRYLVARAETALPPPVGSRVVTLKGDPARRCASGPREGLIWPSAQVAIFFSSVFLITFQALTLACYA